MLTVADVAAFVRHRLDGDPSVPSVPLCNIAGRHLVAMNEWNWLVRPPRAITFSSGSSRVRLPDDFGREIAPQGSGATTRIFNFVDPAYFAEIASTSSTSAGPWLYYATLVFAPDVATGVLTPYAEITPTPTATDNTSVQLWYRAKWPTLQSDEDTIPVPENSMEALFLEVVFATAQGYEEFDQGSLGERLASIKLLPMYADAVAEDALRVQSPVPQRGGMVSNFYGAGYDWSLYPESISGPGV